MLKDAGFYLNLFKKIFMKKKEREREKGIHIAIPLVLINYL